MLIFLWPLLILPILLTSRAASFFFLSGLHQLTDSSLAVVCVFPCYFLIGTTNCSFPFNAKPGMNSIVRHCWIVLSTPMGISDTILWPISKCQTERSHLLDLWIQCVWALSYWTWENNGNFLNGPVMEHSKWQIYL